MDDFEILTEVSSNGDVVFLINLRKQKSQCPVIKEHSHRTLKHLFRLLTLFKVNDVIRFIKSLQSSFSLMLKED